MLAPLFLTIFTAVSSSGGDDDDGIARCTVTVVTRDIHGDRQAGVATGWRMMSPPGGTGSYYPSQPKTLISDEDGQVEIRLPQTARIKRWRGREPALSTDSNTFDVPSDVEHELPDLLGEDVT